MACDAKYAANHCEMWTGRNERLGSLCVFGFARSVDVVIQPLRGS